MTGRSPPEIMKRRRRRFKNHFRIIITNGINGAPCEIRGTWARIDGNRGRLHVLKIRKSPHERFSSHPMYG
jgi:hypothetical protein